MIRRVVFDTTTVISALLFEHGRLAWLRTHWREGRCQPLVCRETIEELARVLGYPKFRLSVEDRQELMADYLPYCEVVDLAKRCFAVCRDAKDQPFLDLAQSGAADVLVSGDDDLLVLVGEVAFAIETPGVYARGWVVE